MVIEFYGGVKKTPGTYFVAEVKNSSLSTRLKRFVFSDTQAYILEFGNQYIRFYKNGGAILETGINITGISQAAECVVTAANSYTDGDEVYISGIVGMTELNGRRFLVSDRAAGNFKIKDIDGNYIDSTDYTAWSSAGTAARVYTLATDYLTADIWDLQFAQKEDVLYITHPSYPQAELTRTGHTAWTITDIDYSVSPAKPGLMPSNITTTTLTLADNTHPSVTLLASADLFDTSTPSLHIGSIWKINSAKSVSAADWLESTAYTTANYVTFNDEIYFCVSNHTSGSSFAVDLAAGKWSLQDIYVKITAVTDSTHATGDVLYSSRLEASPVATTTWSEGAWSAKRGYPKSVTIYESRLTYGYTPYQPQTTWESESGAYKTFKVGVEDSDATSYKADTNEVEVINWLFPANEILIGTVSGLHTLGTGSDSVAFTPTTTRIKKKSRDGTSSVMPQQIGNNVYYWQKYNRKLREYTYSLDVDNYQTNDATAFSEHISKSGIVDMDYQQSPIGVLWCVRADGKMASFTRQIEQKVAGWALHDTQGFYESVAVIPTTSYYDEVWFIVKRTINGVTRRYVEYMVAPEFDDQEDAFFVHSGLTLDNPKTITAITSANPPVLACVNDFTDGDIIKIRGVAGMTEVNYKKYIVAGASGTGFHLHDLDGNNVDASAYTAYISGGEARKCVNSISGLRHLAGKTVQVLTDGASHPDRVVSADGVASLDDYYSEVHCGLGYTGRLVTNDLEPAPGKVQAMGKVKRVSKVWLNIFESLGCQVGDGVTMDYVPFRTSAMPTDQAPPLYTGLKEISFPSGWAHNKRVTIEQNQALPLHILSVILECEVN